MLLETNEKIKMGYGILYIVIEKPKYFSEALATGVINTCGT